MSSLVQKYNVPGPRYTSYPTVPYWDTESFSKERWEESVIRSFNESNKHEGVSLYIHLPFCESLCTFCACHKHITKRHEVEDGYIDDVLLEWDMYVSLFDEVPRIKELHLGGGTPTFFSSKNLTRLMEGILAKAKRDKDYKFSFEGHPNNTSYEQLETLYNLGFRRVSYGVQDYNLKVQKAINRVQPVENVEKVTQWAREIGYTSIGHDLIFGLPFQQLEDVKYTIQETRTLRPERIAYYSYAHVPWIKGVGQRGFKDSDLPHNDEKRTLYEKGKQWLEEAGYHEIGMDHFALETDDMYIAAQRQTLHRNFMGYTPSKTQVMIGLGMSAISDSWYAFAQNDKTVQGYHEQIASGVIPVFRGHVLDAEDLVIRRHILNLMCHFETSWEMENMRFDSLHHTLDLLEEMEKDGLLSIGDTHIKVHNHARAYIRNVCMAFDQRMLKNKPETRVFSMTI